MGVFFAQDEVLKPQEKEEKEHEKMKKEKEGKEKNGEMKVVDEKVVEEDRQERDGMEEEDKENEDVEQEQIQQEIDEEGKTKALDCQGNENGDIGMEGSEEQQDETLEVESDGEGGKSAEKRVSKRDRGADDEQNNLSGMKKPKLDDDFETSSQQLKEEDRSKTTMPLEDTEADEKVTDGYDRGYGVCCFLNV